MRAPLEDGGTFIFVMISMKNSHSCPKKYLVQCYKQLAMAEIGSGVVAGRHNMVVVAM